MKCLVKNAGLGRVLALSSLLAFAPAALLLLSSSAHASQGGGRSFLWHRESGGLSSFGGIQTRGAVPNEVVNGSRLVHEGETPSRKRKA